MTRTSRLLLSGALSGVVWFGLAIAFDKGVRDFNVPVIPTASVPEMTASLVAAIIAGLAVAFVFQRVWLSRSRIVLCFAPIGVLATAVPTFSALTWVFGQAVGAATEPLSVVVGNLVLYAMLSAFTPILYGLALSNCLAIRRVMRSNRTLERTGYAGS